MTAIAEYGGGLYHYIQNEGISSIGSAIACNHSLELIPSTLGEFIGGLLSVVGQRVSLKIERVSPVISIFLIVVHEDSGRYDTRLQFSDKIPNFVFNSLSCFCLYWGYSK